MFKKGQKVSGGQHLSAETKAKVIADRKAGKKWKDIAAELGVPTKRAMTWAKRKWYKEGMSAARGQEIMQKIKDKDKTNDTEVKDPPAVETKEEKEAKEKAAKEKDGQKGEVGKTKKDAGKVVTGEIEKHIRKSDKAPAGVGKKKDEGKQAGGVDEVAKKGLSAPKSVGMWFLLAIVVAVVVILVVYLLLKPSKEEKGDYNQPTEKKSPGGFENRNIDDL